VNTDASLSESQDLNFIAKQFPDLALSDSTDEAALNEITTKYTIRLQIAAQALSDRELRLKEETARAERILRDREIALKEQASKLDRWANPLTVGVLVAALGLVGNFVNGLWSNWNQRAQQENQQKTEKTKLENELIKEAIKPTSEQERAKSLAFFAKNGLITLDDKVVKSLIDTAGTEQPVPGSSTAIFSQTAEDSKAVYFSQSIVDNIASSPEVPFPAGLAEPTRIYGYEIRAIILHDAAGPDSSDTILQSGREDLPGPLAHWLVKSDGTIKSIAPETHRANHLGAARDGLTNSNTIGITVSGVPALVKEQQIENLVRLIVNVADRWEIPSDKIFSHAEMALPAGRRSDMAQQAPAIRQMVEAVRRRHSPQGNRVLNTP
jgi:cytoskeletal protein RodZ